MIEVVVTFAEDVEASPKAVPRFHYRVSDLRNARLYDRIMLYTGNHQLAVDVEGWAELAAVGEVYESDELTAEIIEA